MFVDLILLDALVGPTCFDRTIRKNKLKNLQAGLYDDLFVNIEVPNNIEETKFDDLESYLRNITGFASRISVSIAGSKRVAQKTEKATLKLQNARSLLKEFYFAGCARRVDWKKSLLQEIENEGIIFIDEIDKIANSNVVIL
jgi:ATP-dependent protease HslVU (ClpYQ) ATPase subunit